jgi:RIO-like serine/threonine protein kinase
VLTAEVEKKVLEAFDNIHQLGIVHNDVRPANVLVALPEHSVWIIDFEHAGSANESSCHTECQSVKEMIAKLRMEEVAHSALRIS